MPLKKVLLEKQRKWWNILVLGYYIRQSGTKTKSCLVIVLQFKKFLQKMHKYGCYIYKVFQIWKFYYTFWLVALLKWCKVFVTDWRTDKQFFNKFCLNDINILIFFIFSRSMNNCILLGSEKRKKYTSSNAYENFNFCSGLTEQLLLPTFHHKITR